jgi:hypothetical protein
MSGEEEVPRGWVKPQRSRTVPEVRELIAQKRAEIDELLLELHNLVEGPKLEALAQIRNIMRAHELKVDDVCERPRRGRPPLPRNWPAEEG